VIAMTREEAIAVASHHRGRLEALREVRELCAECVRFHISDPLLTRVYRGVVDMIDSMIAAEKSK
jgi:hypothetical protein